MSQTGTQTKETVEYPISCNDKPQYCISDLNTEGGRKDNTCNQADQEAGAAEASSARCVLIRKDTLGVKMRGVRQTRNGDKDGCDETLPVPGILLLSSN